MRSRWRSLSLSLCLSLSLAYSADWVEDRVALSVQSLLLGSKVFFLGVFSVRMALEGVGVTDCFGFNGLEGRYPDDTACDPART